MFVKKFSNTFFWAVIACYATTVISVTENELEHSLKIFTRALDAVGWYEAGMKFPEGDANVFYQVSYQIKMINQLYEEQLKGQPPDTKLQMIKYILSADHGPLTQLPPNYKQECGKLTSTPDEKPAVDEGQSLIDEGKNYPFKALSFCLVNQVRKRGGDQIIEALKNDRIPNKGGKNWKEVMLARHNMMRDLHYSGFLTMTEDLNAGAQEWANNLAKECKLYHTPQDVLYKDFANTMGENIGMTSGFDDLSVSALLVTNGFYSEIKDYCYPDEFVSGMESKPPGCSLGGPKKTGHFTQLVWKDTQRAGFGAACNPQCQGQGACFLVVRYAPSGNWVGMPNAFKDNVRRPKN